MEWGGWIEREGDEGWSGVDGEREGDEGWSGVDGESEREMRDGVG
jgi:hypothetical protein